MNRWFAVAAILCGVMAGGLIFLLNRPLNPTPSESIAVPAPLSPFRQPNSATPDPSVPPAKPAASSTLGNQPPTSAPLGSIVTFGEVVAPKSAITNPPPDDPDPSGLPSATVLENMRSTFRQYASRFGGNPVGTNPEITAMLNGGNPGQVRFLNTEDGLRINPRGELIDSWGTPYFFHQLSGTEMEIHSAGPDRIMWTGDDLVIR